MEEPSALDFGAQHLFKRLAGEVFGEGGTEMRCGVNYPGKFSSGERGEDLGELVLVGDVGAKDADLCAA